MKHMWKRTLCLLLSAILLLGNVPVQAWATEETTAPTETTVVEPQPTVVETQPVVVSETQPVVVETQPAVTETQPAETSFTTTTDVANDGQGGDNATQTVGYKVFVNDLEINDENKGNVLGDSKVVYDSDNKKLTLKGAEVSSIHCENQDDTLTIQLEEGTKSQITGKLSAKGNITIQGKGKLTVTQIDAGGDLTISGNVEAGKSKDPQTEEIETVITVKNTVTLDDTAHVVVRQAIAFTDTETENNGVTGKGYYRIDVEDGFEQTPEKISIVNGEYFEFVGEKHVAETWTKNDRVHYRTCVTGESCPMGTDIEIDLYGHTMKTAATCTNRAVCEVCGEYGEVAADAHPAENPETEYKSVDNGHKLVYKCCGGDADTNGVQEHDINLVEYADGKATVTVKCEACGYQHESITITPPTNLVWDGNGKEAKCSATGVSIQYFTYDENDTRAETAMESSALPTEPGKYAAVANTLIGDKTPEVVFTISKKPLTEEMVTVQNVENLTYHENQENNPLQKPTVTVSGLVADEFTAEFFRGKDKIVDDYNSAGTVTVKVTVLDKCAHYTGSVDSITYEIKRANVADDAFTPAIPTEKLVYDGKAKELNANQANAFSENDYGEPKVVFYQGENEIKEPINKGDYTLKIHVAENQNYNSAVLEGDPAWTVTIEPTDVYDLDPAMKKQTIRIGTNDFINPDVLGVEKDGQKEKVEGKFTYTYAEKTYASDSAADMAALNTELKKQENKEVQVAYTFTPSDENYKDSIEGTITVDVVRISFEVDGNAVSNDNHAYTVKTNPQPVYLDEDIVTLKETLTAKEGENTTTTGFYVLFQKAGGEEKAMPDAGVNSFKVYFTGELGGVSYEKVVVDSGSVDIARKVPAITVAASQNLTDRDAGEPLVTVASNGEKIKYSTNGGSSWSYDIPVVPAEHGSGVYKIKYEVEQTENFSAKSGYEDVEVVVIPYLTATYKDTLESVQSRINSGMGTWTFYTVVNPLTNPVGNVNEDEGNTFYMDFTKTGSTTITKPNVPVKIYVQPAHISLNVSVKDRYLPYKDGAPVNAQVTVTVKKNDSASDTAEEETFPRSEYNVVCTNITNTADGTTVKNPGRAQVEVQSKGNYIIDNPADMKKEYVVYSFTGRKLTDTWKFEDHGNDDMKAAGFVDGKTVKEELDKKLDSTDFPAEKRSYYNCVMEDTEKIQDTTGKKPYSYDPIYWPDDGITFQLNYPTEDSGQEDEYEIYIMYTVTTGADRSDLNTTAGTIVELNEAGSTLGINEYKKYDNKIHIRLKNYAAVCIAEKNNEEKEYAITAKTNSSSQGTVSFKVGSSTTAKTSSAAKQGETITVTATAKSGYELTRLNYTYNNGTEKVTTAIDKNSSGKYTFTMPAASVEINATFAKKNTNPSSGDTSNIHLWLTILAASAVGIVALVIVWFKKRKK